MKTASKRAVTVLMLGTSLTLMSTLSNVAFAEEQSPWSIKAYGVFGSANESFSVDQPGGNRIEAGGNGTLGIGGAVEYRLSDLIGLEAATSFSKTPDFDYEEPGTTTDIGEGPSMSSIQLAVNFHLLSTKKLDIYAGPRIAMIAFGDFKLDVNDQRVSYEVDNEFGWGATAGVSYQLGNGPLSLVAEITYLNVEMNVTDVAQNTTKTLDFNPTSSNLGIRYQF